MSGKLTERVALEVGTEDTKSFVLEPCEDWLSLEKSEWLDWLSLISSFIVISFFTTTQYTEL